MKEFLNIKIGIKCRIKNSTAKSYVRLLIPFMAIIRPAVIAHKPAEDQNKEI